MIDAVKHFMENDYITRGQKTYMSSKFEDILDSYDKARNRNNKVRNDKSLEKKLEDFEKNNQNDFIKEFLPIIEEETTHFSPSNYLAHMLSETPLELTLASIMGVVNTGNQVAGEVSRLPNLMEQRFGQRINEIIGYRGQRPLTAIVSGGTEANIMALTLARNRAYNANIKEEGITNSQEGIILAPKTQHYSLQKAANLLGIGTNYIIPVEIDENCRMDLNHLYKNMNFYHKNNYRIISVVGIMGTTESGSIDNLNEIHKYVRSFEESTKHEKQPQNIWLHLDAAYGLPYILSNKFYKQQEHKISKMNKFDSITFDPHKNLYTPYNAGAISLKRGLNVIKDISTDANYLKGHRAHPGGFKLLGSQSTSGVFSSYLALFGYGEHFYAETFNTCLDNTEYMKNRMQQVNELEGKIEVINDPPEMNLLNFRYIPKEHLSENCASGKQVLQGVYDPSTLEKINNINKNIYERINERGEYILSDTEGLAQSNLYAHRACLMNPQTKKSDIEGFIKHYIDTIRKISS